MYGLKQAAIQIGINWYNIWSHDTCKTKFCLRVDDFGVMYYNKEDTNHLSSSLKKYYSITVDWNGNNYCGLNLGGNVKINMQIFQC